MRRYEEPAPNSRFMKEQTQKISLKSSKVPTPDKPILHKTLNIQKEPSRRRHSDYSQGEEFMGFLSQYIHNLNQPSSKGRSIDVSVSSKEERIVNLKKQTKLEKINRELEEERLLNQKLAKKVQGIQDILISRETELDRLSRKVEKMMDKENSRRNTNSRETKWKPEGGYPKYKVSDFMKKQFVPASSEDEDLIVKRSKNYTQNDEAPRRRKSTIVQRSGHHSKPLLTQELQNLISQTVGLKTVGNKYKMI